ncbi:hypothetical protein D3C78_1295960 [compost metagenome]
MAGRCAEADTAATALQLTGRDTLHRAAECHEILGQLAEGGFVDHLETHEVHAGLIGFAQYQREFVDLAPRLEVDAAALVAVDLDQAQKLDVVFQGLGHVQYAHLDVAGAHYTFVHLDTSVVFFVGSKTSWIRLRILDFASPDCSRKRLFPDGAL